LNVREKVRLHAAEAGGVWVEFEVVLGRR
jgi:hypothetical protein